MLVYDRINYLFILFLTKTNAQRHATKKREKEKTKKNNEKGDKHLEKERKEGERERKRKETEMVGVCYHYSLTTYTSETPFEDIAIQIINFGSNFFFF
jgi:chromatin remodeling complex protein RSC6